MARGPSPTKPTLVSGSTETRAGQLIAGDAGAEWALPGGPRVRAAAGSVLRVLPSTQPLTLGSGPPTPGYTVLLKRGDLRIDLGAEPTSAVVVSAPRQVTLIAQSGTSRVVASDGMVAIANEQGLLTAASGRNAYRPLPPGHVQLVSAAESSTRPMVAAPAAVSGKRLYLVHEAPAELAGLRWANVEGAASYRIVVTRAGGDTVAEAQTQEPVLESSLELQPGAYQLRVFARESTGLESPHPLLTTIHVVGLVLPPGAYRDSSGAIHLAPNQRVRFVGSGGLEMARGKVVRFSRAVPSAGLFRNASTPVRFRIAGSKVTETLRLEPRTLRARVELSPRGATWPKDPIDVRIKLEDPSGGSIPTDVEMRPRVELGIQRIGVAFRREGTWLHARIPPRQGSGPWVLRVEVEDQHGLSLGRDFLEISHRAAQPNSRVRIITRTRKVSSR